MQYVTWFNVDTALYSMSGFAVGILVGMTGVGGGSLMTPLLILLFGIHPSTAVGTDLLYAAITKTAGATFHGLNRTIDWRITSRLAMGSVPATVMTIFFLHRMAAQGISYNQNSLAGACFFVGSHRIIRSLPSKNPEIFGSTFRWAASGYRDPGHCIIRRGARHASEPHVSWCGRSRDDGSCDALSSRIDGSFNRLGYRSCRTAHLTCWNGALVSGFD